MVRQLKRSTNVLRTVFRIMAACAFTSLCVGCDYYKQQTGYFVTRSESLTHHYDGFNCFSHGAGESCNFPEIRYTFIHKQVKIVASCQAWDAKNNCGQLKLGEAYNCEINSRLPILDCKPDGVLGIESSEQM